MKSSMTSIRVIYVHREKEKVDFKSREVNCLKECAVSFKLKGKSLWEGGNTSKRNSYSTFI